MSLNKQAEHKKPYQSPQLFVYGNIRELTMNTLVGQSMDNPNISQTKTSTG